MRVYTPLHATSTGVTLRYPRCRQAFTRPPMVLATSSATSSSSSMAICGPRPALGLIARHAPAFLHHRLIFFASPIAGRFSNGELRTGLSASRDTAYVS